MRRGTDLGEQSQITSTRAVPEDQSQNNPRGTVPEQPQKNSPRTVEAEQSENSPRRTVLEQQLHKNRAKIALADQALTSSPSTDPQQSQHATLYISDEPPE